MLPTELYPFLQSYHGSPQGWQAQSPQVQSQRGECRSEGPERRSGAGKNQSVALVAMFGETPQRDFEE